MTPTDDADDQLERLIESGAPFEQRLMRSAKLDAADPGSRERTFETAAGALGRRDGGRKSVGRVVLLSAAVAAAALAGVLFERLRSAAPTAVLSAEPRPIVAPSAPASAPPAAAAKPPERTPCPRVTVAPGQDPLIDDMEDENARILIREGRSGVWMVLGDSKAKQTPRAGQNAFPVPIPDGRDGSRYAVRVFGGRQQNPGPAASLGLSPGRCYDASAYAGLEFWARGKSRIHVRVTMIDVMAAEFGGLCRKDCYDSHVEPVDLSPEWTLHRIRWEELEQVGWGRPEVFDPRRLLSIEFSVLPADTPFDFWIDDVAFIRK